MAQKDEKVGTPRHRSFTDCFNELYFCYSPVHQVRQYYRIGVFDDCSGKWRALVDALLLKTKKSSQVQEILDARDKENPHIWTFRTREEASEHWRKLFGHMNDRE